MRWFQKSELIVRFLCKHRCSLCNFVLFSWYSRWIKRHKYWSVFFSALIWTWQLANNESAFWMNTLLAKHNEFSLFNEMTLSSNLKWLKTNGSHERQSKEKLKINTQLKARFLVFRNFQTLLYHSKRQAISIPVQRSRCPLDDLVSYSTRSLFLLMSLWIKGLKDLYLIKTTK